MPNSASTSALPDLEVIARLPCLATVTPAAAATSATVVEILNVPSLSPPVPQTSSISRPRVSSSSGTGSALSRSSLANAAISAVVSPLVASAVRNLALASGVAVSSVRQLMASRTCSSVSSVPASSCLVRVFNMGRTIRLPSPLGQARIARWLHFGLSRGMLR